MSGIVRGVVVLVVFVVGFILVICVVVVASGRRLIARSGRGRTVLVVAVIWVVGRGRFDVVVEVHFRVWVDLNHCVGAHAQMQSTRVKWLRNVENMF